MVQVEVEFLELYEGQPLFADVDSYLRGQGFVFHTFWGISSRCFKPMVLGDDVNRGANQFLWSDAVYVRDWSKLAPMPADKLLKYATLMHGVFSSPDLCHFLLEHLDSRSGTACARAYMEKLMSLPAQAP